MMTAQRDPHWNEEIHEGAKICMQWIAHNWKLQKGKKKKHFNILAKYGAFMNAKLV